MKKTLKSLLIAGALFFAVPQVVNAQLHVGDVVTITLTNDQATGLNLLNPMLAFSAGQTFTFVVMTEPDIPDADPTIQALEFFANGIYSTQLPQPNADYTLQYLAPVDFGLSAVLGVGAIAAVKRARNRRKQNAVA